MGRGFRAVAAALTLLLLTACGAGLDEPKAPTGPVVYEQDGAEVDVDQGGLNFKVLTFQWRYLKNVDQIKVIGWVQNLSGEPVQACRIIAEGFDQFGESLGVQETYLAPTFIPPEGKGRFDFYLHHGEWAEHLVLRCRFEIRY